MNPIYKPLSDHFRCPESLLAGNADKSCLFTSLTSAQPACSGKYDEIRNNLGPGVVKALGMAASIDPGEAIAHLRREEYPFAAKAKAALSRPQLVRSLYYTIRPMLPVAIRKWAQKAYFAGWESLPFPNWPVDFTVENILERLLIQCMKARHIQTLPFIWFWPNSKKSCVVVTHDVETEAGRDFTSAVMNLDDSYGVRSSFQLIPVDRYAVSSDYLSEIKNRGFEINVHDLAHDGSLFCDHKRFLRQAREIRQFGRQWNALGFRSGALYRRQEWFDALEFEYDMSVPNVAHLEPQRGGCCTVFPYFIGNILEIPVTAAQDYSLFHILNDYSMALWQKQIELICRRNGLVSFIVHPDYIVADHARQLYESLLQRINDLREPEELWVTPPGELNRWWRMRQRSTVVNSGSSWTIEGPANRHGQLAYAHLAGERIVYEVTSSKTQHAWAHTANNETKVAS